MITDWSILSSRDDTPPARSKDSGLSQRSRRITHLQHSWSPEVYELVVLSGDKGFETSTDGHTKSDRAAWIRISITSWTASEMDLVPKHHSQCLSAITDALWATNHNHRWARYFFNSIQALHQLTVHLQLSHPVVMEMQRPAVLGWPAERSQHVWMK